MTYPANFEEKLGFDKIRALLKKNCISELGGKRVEEIEFSTDFEQIQTQLKCVDEFVEICNGYDDFPVTNYHNLVPTFQHLKIEGSYITAAELFELRSSLDTLRQISKFFRTYGDEHFPELTKLVQQIGFPGSLFQKIDEILDKYGNIKDNASPDLQKCRREIRVKQSSISKITNQILSNAQNEGIIDKDTNITVRDGKMLLPVSQSNKRKIKGIVYDESSTGKTCYIEPIEVIELDNEIKELEFAEKREIIRILSEFSNELRPHLDELIYSYQIIGDLDFIRAKALFAIRVDAKLPNLVDEHKLQYFDSRHPLLQLALEKEKKEIIPLTFFINEKSRLIIISGPNAGGKSVCLKTVGLIQYMVQCGLLYPGNKNSTIGIFNSIFIDIGDEQSIENDLSTYSSHLKNMLHFIDHADSASLVLIDEFGTGTEPLVGGAIAESVLERLNEHNVKGIITTHYTNIKAAAANLPGIVNGAMMYDTEKLKPLYILKVGKPGSSFAFEIAANIGLPRELLKRAEEKVGTNHIDYEKQLKAITREKRFLSQKKLKTSQLEEKLDKLTQHYAEELEKTKNQRKEILKETKSKSDELLSTLNKRIENTIFEIKRANAEKEQTKHHRQELEKDILSLKDGFSEEGSDIDKKIEKIKQRQKRKKKKTQTIEKGKSTEPLLLIEKGGFVKIEDNNTIGEVLDIHGDTVKIAIGEMITQVQKSRLIPVSRHKVKESTRPKVNLNSTYLSEVSKRKNEFKSQLDLRGKRADDAIFELQDFIDEAIIVEANQVKILHGTGNGILRQLVREYLSTIELVKRFKDEQIEFGGAGITVVDFEY